MKLLSVCICLMSCILTFVPVCAQQPQEHQAWTALLENQPPHNGQAVYTFSAQYLLQDPLPASLNELPSSLEMLFITLLAQAARQARQYVVIYNTPDLMYRWVKEECYYGSYLLGKLVNQSALDQTLPWNTRLYLLTAYPKNGAYLTPAQGERFELADGSVGLRWQYHTALLVIAPQENRYIPAVLDPFLTGETPSTLRDFVAHFHPDTVFKAVPFRRNQTVEDALKIPQRQEGKIIWVDNIAYQPAPVEK